jgi:hypothetical protein
MPPPTVAVISFASIWSQPGQLISTLAWGKRALNLASSTFSQYGAKSSAGGESQISTVTGASERVTASGPLPAPHAASPAAPAAAPAPASPRHSIRRRVPAGPCTPRPSVSMSCSSTPSVASAASVASVASAASVRPAGARCG